MRAVSDAGPQPGVPGRPEASLRATVAAMATAGSDLVIVGIPKAEPPTVIERIAHALD